MTNKPRTADGNELHHTSADRSVEVVIIPPENARSAMPARNSLVALRLRPRPGSRVTLMPDGTLELAPLGIELGALLQAISSIDPKIQFQTSRR